MEERSSRSWSAKEAGTGWAGGRSLAVWTLLWRRSQNSGARPGGSCARRPGPPVVLDRLMAGPRRGGVPEGSGSELLHTEPGFAQYGGGPGTALFTACTSGAQTKWDSDKSRRADARVAVNRVTRAGAAGQGP